MWKQCVPKPRNHFKKGHYRPMNFAFDSPYKRRGGAIACRFQVSPSLFMGAVSDICFCCGMVMLRCPPLKLDASLCLRTHGLPPGRVTSELCLGSPRDPTSVPTFQLQAEMFLALHDQMILLLLQLRHPRMVAVDFGAAPVLRSKSFGSGVADRVISGLCIQDVGLGCVSPASCV